MTTPSEVRAWAKAHHFTGNGHVHTMFRRPESKRTTYKVELLKYSVRISALIKTPRDMIRWVKGPFMWRTIAYGYYKNLTVDGKQLKGLRLSRQVH